MENFIKIEIEQPSAEACEILMAELSENNFYAFEQDGTILTAYILEKDFNEDIFKSFLKPSAVYKYSVIADKNWNQEWESQLEPVTINDFVGIRASFHEPLKNVEHEIIITPKMSFGTGHHATTFLMIELMQKINFQNKSVLDFGTGTGVLAILAEKLGASSIVAIDYDEWSITNASENVLANNCTNINLEKANTISGVSCVDIIVANINYNILVENAKNLSMISKKGTQLIISGFLWNDEDRIVSIFVNNGFSKKRRAQKNEWIAIEFENQ